MPLPGDKGLDPTSPGLTTILARSSKGKPARATPNAVTFEPVSPPTSKINPEFEENFRGPKTNHLRTTIHHESTTNSPSKNHVLPPAFAKTPCKNAKTAFPKKMRKSGSNQRRAKA
jgi:hypothetical protein